MTQFSRSRGGVRPPKWTIRLCLYATGTRPYVRKANFVAAVCFSHEIGFCLWCLTSTSTLDENKLMPLNELAVASMMASFLTVVGLVTIQSALPLTSRSQSRSHVFELCVSLPSESTQTSIASSIQKVILALAGCKIKPSVVLAFLKDWDQPSLLTAASAPVAP